MHLDRERNKELKKKFLDTKNKLNQFKDKKLKLVKFEVFTYEWKDYSAAHSDINGIRILLGISNEKLVLKDLNDKLIKLDVCSKAWDIIKLNDKGFELTYDDEKRFRWYKGKGMRLNYEWIN